LVHEQEVDRSTPATTRASPRNRYTATAAAESTTDPPDHAAPAAGHAPTRSTSPSTPDTTAGPKPAAARPQQRPPLP
jgi:hypothetical protein